MENIKAFISGSRSSGYGIDIGYGIGYGSGSSSGSISGHGYGCGSSSGGGYGGDHGHGSGVGNSSGYGGDHGHGSGVGNSSGYGGGNGSGASHDGGGGIKAINGQEVYYIDYTPTVIYHVRGNVARGAVLCQDLSLEPCYIVKNDGLFAHGETLRKAMEALTDKLFEDMPEEERIKAFMDCHKLGINYPVQDLYDWHHRLTGSCKMGRDVFAAGHGIDVEHDEMTVENFIRLTKSAYNGGVIAALEAAYAGRRV